MRVTGTSKTTTPSTKPSSAKPTSSTTGKKMTSRNSSNSLIAKAEREKEAEKEKEKAAWDRRRTYDPRKAVQQVCNPAIRADNYVIICLITLHHLSRNIMFLI